MRVVMLGGAPGTGKSTVARRLLEIAGGGPQLVQWVDVDSLWLHQPWRADERMTAMMRANLRSVAGHAARAGVDVLLITWVFQSADMHQLVTALLPPGVRVSPISQAGREGSGRFGQRSQPQFPPQPPARRDQRPYLDHTARLPASTQTG